MAVGVTGEGYRARRTVQGTRRNRKGRSDGVARWGRSTCRGVFNDRDCTSPLSISAVGVNGATRKRKHAGMKEEEQGVHIDQPSSFSLLPAARSGIFAAAG